MPPDDSVIRVGIVVDASGVKTGMAEALASVRAHLAEMKEEYRQAGLFIRESLSGMTKVDPAIADLTGVRDATSTAADVAAASSTLATNPPGASTLQTIRQQIEADVAEERTTLSALSQRTSGPVEAFSGSPRFGNETTVPVPGEKTAYSGRYAVREMADVEASHSGQTFLPNPAYPYRNDRAYENPANAERVIRQASAFDPHYLINDNPDAVNGPPIVDPLGNVLGGNSRAMTAERVYSSQNSEGADKYRSLLAEKAATFGIDPAQISQMQQPLLVRELSGVHNPQDAITDFNKTGTAALSGSERAISDARRLSPETLSHLGDQIAAQGEGGTLASVLGGTGGPQIIERLISEGVISPQERPQYLDDRGLVTPEGKQRVSRSVVGRFFDSPEEYESASPTLRNKLERIAGPIAATEDRPEWNIAPHTKGAVDILTEQRKRGIPNLSDLEAQGSMFGGAKGLGGSGYDPDSMTLARVLEQKPTDVQKQYRQFAEDARFTRSGDFIEGLVSPPTPGQSFDTAFRKPVGAEETGILTPRAVTQTIPPAEVTPVVEPTPAQTVEQAIPGAIATSTGPPTQLVAPKPRYHEAETPQGEIVRVVAQDEERNRATITNRHGTEEREARLDTLAPAEPLGGISRDLTKQISKAEGLMPIGSVGHYLEDPKLREQFASILDVGINTDPHLESSGIKARGTTADYGKLPPVITLGKTADEQVLIHEMTHAHDIVSGRGIADRPEAEDRAEKAQEDFAERANVPYDKPTRNAKALPETPESRFEQSGGKILSFAPHAGADIEGDFLNVAAHPQGPGQDEGIRQLHEFNPEGSTRWPPDLASRLAEHNLTPQQIVGYSRIHPDVDDPARMASQATHVAEDFRRQGVATGMYDAAETAQSQRIGQPAHLQPSINVSDDAQAFWAARTQNVPAESYTAAGTGIATQSLSQEAINEHATNIGRETLQRGFVGAESPAAKGLRDLSEIDLSRIKESAITHFGTLQEGYNPEGGSVEWHTPTQELGATLTSSVHEALDQEIARRAKPEQANIASPAVVDRKTETGKQSVQPETVTVADQLQKQSTAPLPAQPAAAASQVPVQTAPSSADLASLEEENNRPPMHRSGMSMGEFDLKHKHRLRDEYLEAERRHEAGERDAPRAQAQAAGPPGNTPPPPSGAPPAAPPPDDDDEHKRRQKQEADLDELAAKEKSTAKVTEEASTESSRVVTQQSDAETQKVEQKAKQLDSLSQKQQSTSKVTEENTSTESRTVVEKSDAEIAAEQKVTEARKQYNESLQSGKFDSDKFQQLQKSQDELEAVRKQESGVKESQAVERSEYQKTAQVAQESATQTGAAVVDSESQATGAVVDGQTQEQSAHEQTAEAAQEGSARQNAAAEQTGQTQKKVTEESEQGARRTSSASRASSEEQTRSARQSADAESQSAKQGATANEQAAHQTASAHTQAASSQRAQLALLQQQHRNLGQEIHQVTARIVSAETQSTDAIKAGHEQLGQRLQHLADEERAQLDQLIAKQEELTAEIKRTAEAANVAGASLTGMSAKAQIAVGALSDSTGRVEYGLMRLLSTSKALAPVMEAAFPVFIIAAFAEILYSIPGKIREMADELVGFGKEEKKYLEELASSSFDPAMEQLKLQEALRDTSTIGLVGLGKTNAELKNLKENTKAISDLLTEKRSNLELWQKNLNVDEHKFDVLKVIPGAPPPAFMRWWTGVNDDIKEARENALKFDKEVKELAKDLQYDVPKKKATEDRTQVEQSLANSRDLTKAQIEATAKRNEVVIAGDEQYIKEERSLFRMSAEEENRQLQADALRKLQIEQERIQALKALAIRTEKDTRKPAGPELLALDTEEVEKINAYRRESAQLDTNLTQEQIRHAREVAMARIEATQQAGAVEARRVEQAAREEYQATRERAENHAALLVGAAQKETAQLIAAETERAAIQKKADQDRLAELQKSPEPSATQIIALNQKIVDDEKESQSRILQLRREGDRESLADHKRYVAEMLRLTAELAKLQEDREIAGLEIQKLQVERKYIVAPPTSLNPFAPSPQDKEKQEIGQIELQELDVKRKTLQQELDAAVAENRAEGDGYRKLVNEKEQLDQRYAQKKKALENQQLAAELAQYRQLANQITQDFLNGINQWIQGQKHFSQAMRESWNSIVMDAINQIEKMGQKWIVEHVFMAAIEKLFHVKETTEESAKEAKRLGQHAATNAAVVASDTALAAVQTGIATTQAATLAGITAATTATESAARVVTATGDAGLAAAGTFAWYSQVNPPIAPTMAAIALAEGLGYAGLAAFEQGGIVPKDMTAQVHAKEMVLPAHIAEHVMATAGNAYSDTRRVTPAGSPDLFHGSRPASSGMSSNLQQMFSNTSGGDTHVHIHAPLTFHGTPPPEDFKTQLTKHVDHIGRLSSRQYRKFNR